MNGTHTHTQLYHPWAKETTGIQNGSMTRMGNAKMIGTPTHTQLYHLRAMETIGIQNGSMTRMENENLAEFFRPIYIELLESLSFINSPEAAYPPQLWDLELTTTITKLIDPSISQDNLTSHSMINLVRFGILTCRKHPAKFQTAMAHYVVLIATIDDAVTTEGEKFMRDMELFQVKMCSPEGYARLFPGRGPLHPLLENLVTFLTTDLCPLFLKHPILHNILIKATLDFIAACLLEELHKGKRLQLGNENKLYPAFLRGKTGLAEGFSVLWLSPLADELDDEVFYNSVYVVAELDDFWNDLNDLFSMYKEVKAGDTVGYIFNYAQVNDITLHDAVRKVFVNVIETQKRIMSIADSSGSPKFKEYMEQLYQGYILWHISFSKRYQLNEVLAEWFEGCFWT